MVPFFLFWCIAMLAGPAYGHEVEAVAEDPPWLTFVLGAIAGLLPSVLNMFVSGDTAAGKFINALSLAFLKARPDPSRQ